MAVYAAHLTRTLQGTPSIFQVTAQEALGATVKPALRKLVEYLAAVYPNKFGWCLEWYDEVFLLFDSCLQYHYLKHYAASFSESFYGLLRVPIHPSSEFSTGQRLPASLERGSLALLVLAPYVRDRIERVVHRWREEEEDGKLGKGYQASVRAALIRVHGVSHVVYSCARLALLARYVCGRGAAPSPPLWALGLALRDAPERERAGAWADVWARLWAGDVGRALAAGPALGRALLSCAEHGAFLVQFLRWWETRAAHSDAALPPPPPPQKDERASRWTNKCPICLHSWKIPTVLPVSGYIFCYSCIAAHVRARGACPVTRCPCSERALVRLYSD